MEASVAVDFKEMFVAVLSSGGMAPISVRGGASGTELLSEFSIEFDAFGD